MATRTQSTPEAVPAPRGTLLPWFLLGFSLLTTGAVTLWARMKTQEVQLEKDRLRDTLQAADINIAKLKALEAENKKLQAGNQQLLADRLAFETHLQALKQEMEALDAEGPKLRATYDFLTKSLEADIRAKLLAVNIGKGRVSVTLMDGLFDDTQLNVSAAGNALLLRLGAALKRLEATQAIQISAHAEETAIPPALADRFAGPWEFSTAQAAIVAKHLVEKSQVPGERLSAAGYAQFHPMTSNATPDGQKRYRRVEILLASALGKPVEASKNDSRNAKNKRKRR